MNCEPCNCVVGETYSLNNGTCTDCGNVNPDEVFGTYIGLMNGYHGFTFHNVSCSKCGTKVSMQLLSCRNRQGIDVTEEFHSVLVRK